MYANKKLPAMFLAKTYQRATDVCDDLTAKIKKAALKREAKIKQINVKNCYIYGEYGPQVVDQGFIYTYDD